MSMHEETPAAGDIDNNQRRQRMERAVLAGLGGALMGAAIWQRRRWSVPLALAGALLLVRGLRELGLVTRLRQAADRNAYQGLRMEGSIRVRVPVGEVYQFWRTLENLPAFMRHLESVQAGEDGVYTWVARVQPGAPSAWQTRLIVERPNQMLAWRSLAEEPVYHLGVVQFRPAHAGRHTELSVLLEYEPPAGAAAAWLARMAGVEPAQMIRRDLLLFKDLVESGVVEKQA